MSIKVDIPFDQNVDAAVAQIKHEMERRSWLVANELRNSALEVLRGDRSGRVYTIPATRRKYTASAPGEPPAMRTGTFRRSWQPTALVESNSYISRIESDIQTEGKRKYNLGTVLEEGTSRMAPRPFHDRIIQHAEPQIKRIYSEPYF